MTTLMRAARSMRVPTVHRSIAPPRVTWHDLAACTFLPNLHWLSFKDDIVHAGHVTMVVLSHRLAGGDCGYVVRSRLDVHKAQVRRGGQVSWNLHRPCATCYWHSSPAPQQIPHEIAGSRLLPIVARQLFWACMRVAERRSVVPPVPVLPSTLLGLPPGAGVEPYPSPLVMRRARQRQIHWAEAWGELYLQLYRPDLEERLGQRLIDARLVRPTLHILNEWHLIGPLLGRRIANPARRLERPFDMYASGAREYLPQLLGSGCTDADLERVVKRPSQPLIASRVARIQVWRPRP